jgi:phosphoserine phosphatase
MTLEQRASDFLDSVLCLKPRTAVFDCDGTLWGPDAGEGFLEWELERGLVSGDTAHWIRVRYAEYKAGRVPEDVMCGEMVTMHAGLFDKDLERASEEYFAAYIEPGIFPEMQELTQRLRDQGCAVWAVSSSNDWVIQAGMRRFGIPREHVLAAAVAIDNGRATDRLLRIPSAEGKPRAIRKYIHTQVDVAFGNSKWDEAMLQIAQHSFAVNPTADLERVAKKHSWSIYFPDSTGKK